MYPPFSNYTTITENIMIFLVTAGRIWAVGGQNRAATNLSESLNISYFAFLKLTNTPNRWLNIIWLLYAFYCMIELTKRK